MARFAEGDLSKTVDLSERSFAGTTIALGATAGKTAEITAVDGKLWIMAPAPDGVEVVHDAEGQGGSLFVSSAPSSWDGGQVIQAVDVDAILAAVATQRAGSPCAAADAVPFVVRGHAEALSWSIVGQPAGKQGSEADVDVVIVGFWSPAARGIYVPGSMDGHLHVVVPSANLAGHLGSVQLRPGATLHLP